MLSIERLLKNLLVIQVWQTFAIYQASKGVPRIFNIKPLPLNSSSETLKQMTHVRYQQPGYTNTYPGRHQLYNRWSVPSPTRNLRTNEQPAAAHDFKGDQWHKESLSINYHNEIDHLKSIERASPLANNRHWENQGLNERSQRNLRENHDNKLIEQNMQEKENVNEGSGRQSTQAEALKHSSQQPSTLTSRPTIETSHEIRYLHDIFLNYPKPHHVNFGHIELSPVLFEKHFESQKKGNRYRGEIMWLDKTGSFSQHYWDLAQGSLMR